MSLFSLLPSLFKVTQNDYIDEDSSLQLTECIALIIMVGGIREKYDPEPIWEKEIAVAENWIQYIDDAVMKGKP